MLDSSFVVVKAEKLVVMGSWIIHKHHKSSSRCCKSSCRKQTPGAAELRPMGEQMPKPTEPVCLNPVPPTWRQSLEWGICSASIRLRVDSPPRKRWKTFVPTQTQKLGDSGLPLVRKTSRTRNNTSTPVSRAVQACGTTT